MPSLAHPVSLHFNKLFEDGKTAADAGPCDCRIMVGAEDFFVLGFVVRILWAKYSIAAGSLASEMFNVVFLIECGDVGPPEGSAASAAEEVQPFEVICLAKSKARAILQGKETVGYNLWAILNLKSAAGKDWDWGRHGG